MSIPPPDILHALLQLFRTAAREVVDEALSARRDASSGAFSKPLVDKRDLAHSLGVSTATVDRLCREQSIPFIHVGDVRRFDVDAVRAALVERGAKIVAKGAPSESAPSRPQFRRLTRHRNRGPDPNL